MPYRLIAHEIRKRKHEVESQIIPRDELLPQSNAAETLVNDLREAFNRQSRQGAKFRQRGDELAPLQEYLLNYLQNRSDESFVGFTNIATRKLRTCMEREPLSVGGYLVFAEYERGEERYIVVVLLSAKARAQFDANLNLREVATLDLEHLRHAARFRFSGSGENAAGTVQLVAKSSEGNFFKDFIDCDLITDSSIQANLLKTALNFWAESSGLTKNQREEIMKSTYGYWNGCRKVGRTMTLVGLANHIYPDDPSPFVRHLTDEGADLDGEFNPPKAKDMRQFQKFSFSGDGLKLEFDRGVWQNMIRVNGRVVTIRNAPEELLTQIRDELT
jgi:nucleoid-associated protein